MSDNIPGYTTMICSECGRNQYKPSEGTIVVTGSRNWFDAEFIRGKLDLYKPGRVIHGGYPMGADRIASGWAKDHGATEIVYHANWNTHGKRAGPLRNHKMLADNAHAVVLAFPMGDSKGTRGCVRIAHTRGMEVHVFEGSR